MSVRIEQVDGRRGVAAFVDAAWAVQGGRPTFWVPPLRAMVRDALDTRRNPFYRDADRALFVARRGKEVVGRVAAVENRWHNNHHGDRVGFFGFFECLDDQEAARALLGAAEEWLAARNLTTVRGPMSPSMKNHECGLLVDGFDTPPVIMTPWNPPYYGGLVEGAGFRKVQDLLGYYIPAGDKLAVPDRVRRLAERTLRHTRITFRTLDVSTLEQEARKVLQLYNEAWAGNWGFVPPSWEEFWHTAKDLKAVLAADFFVAEVDGEIVGFMLIARDINRLLRDMPSGRLWPTNVVKLLRGTQKILSGRVVLLGLKTEYRNRGLFPLFAYEAARRALEIRAEGAEASWVLDHNESIVAPLEAMGLAAYKRWRIYEK